MLHETPVTKAFESFYLETLEGLFFSVKGLEHPPDRWISVLRYAPDAEAGDRVKGGSSYRRLYRFAEQEEWIRKACPQYRSFDPVFQVALQSVPRSRVRRVYDPQVKLHELSNAPACAGLEGDAVALAYLLSGEAGVPLADLGITGSLLIGMHTKNSDMDMVVIGEQSCLKAYRALQRLLDDRSGSELSRLDARGVEGLYAERSVDTKMDFRDFVSLESRKVNQGFFRRRTYFIRFVKEPDEAGNVYGGLRYAPLGRLKIEGVIADDCDAIFTPCRYLLKGVRSLEGSPMAEPDEIVSFRGRFCEQARTGDRVGAAGTLEGIQDEEGRTRYRLLLGNSREDTMVVLG